MTTLDEAIERVAEAIWNASWDTRPSGGSVLSWSEVRPEVQAKYRAMAHAAFSEFLDILRADGEFVACCPSCDGHACEERKAGL